jgi:hypothetical protein
MTVMKPGRSADAPASASADDGAYRTAQEGEVQMREVHDEGTVHPREGLTMRPAIRHVAATTATILVFAVTATVFAVMAPPAAQARVIDCVVQPQPPQGACYEPVWVNGQQIIMTFPQAGHPLDPVPSAKTQPWYILGPQTGTAQGQSPGFFHDHVITTAPGEGGFTPLLHGYLVICSPRGISTGACTYNWETPPGGTAPIPLTQSVTGYDLTFAADIQAAASAGLVILIDTGTVIIGTAGPRD